MKSYWTVWTNRYLTLGARSIDDMIQRLREAANNLEVMKNAGVTLDPSSDTANDMAILLTDNPDVAQEFEFDDPEEYLDSDDPIPFELDDAACTEFYERDSDIY